MNVEFMPVETSLITVVRGFIFTSIVKVDFEQKRVEINILI